MTRATHTLLALVLVVGAFACATVPAVRQHVATECGVTFPYPASWTIDAVSGDTIILRRDPSIRDVTAEAVLIQCGRGPFEEGAAATGFEPNSSGWTIDVGAGPQEASRLSDGLDGRVMGHCYDGEIQGYRACDEYARYRWVEGRWIGASGTEEEVVRSVVSGASLSNPPDSGAADASR
jgi:hypothetical protein